MESPLTTNDLNHLLARLTDNCCLDTNDRNVLERGTKAMTSMDCSSEMANTVNQIWKVLGQLTDHYWDIIGFVACSEQMFTKAMAITSISEQIGGETGKFMSGEMRQSLAGFLFGLEESIVQGELEDNFLKGAVCKAIVAFLLVEWQGLLKGYIQEMVSGLSQFNQLKTMFFLDVLDLLIEKSFNPSSNKDNTSEEQNTIRANVEEDLRLIISTICSCLKDSCNPAKIIPKTLTLLQNLITMVPMFEIFNSTLIEILAQLLHNRDFFQPSLFCIKQIFSFQQNSEGGESNARMEMKLFVILEGLLGSYNLDRDRRGDRQRGQEREWENQRTVDKQSQSTNDSFYSKVTRNPRDEKRLAAHELVELLYLYLQRYVVDGEYERKGTTGTTTGNYYDREENSFNSPESHQLSNFAPRYWQFLDFLTDFGQKLPFNLIIRDEEALNFEHGYSVCVKLMLSLFTKLGLHPTADKLERMVEMILTKLTPLDKDFRQFYAEHELIQDQHRVYKTDEVWPTSEECLQNYLSILKVLTDNRQLTSIYKTVQQSILQQITTRFNRLHQANCQPRLICELKNLINRFSWNSVQVYLDFGYEEVDLAVIAGGFLSYCKNSSYKVMQKCLIMNIKYLQLPGKKQFCSLILGEDGGGIRAVKEETLELHVVIVAKMLKRREFELTDLGGMQEHSWESYRELVAWVNIIEEKGLYCKVFPSIYPGVFKLVAQIVKYGRIQKERQQQTADGERGQQSQQQIAMRGQQQMAQRGHQQMAPRGRPHNSKTNERVPTIIDFPNLSTKILEEILQNKFKSLLSQVNDTQLSEHKIPTIKRLNTFFNYLDLIASHLMETYELHQDKVEKESHGVLRHHVRFLMAHMGNLQTLYKTCSTHIEYQTHQSYDAQEVVSFMEGFIRLVGQLGKMNLMVESLVDESRESADKLNKKKQEGANIFRGVAMVLGEDFENQRQFKCVAYLDFVVDEFRSIERMEAGNESRTFKEEMNFRLKMISTALQQEEVFRIDQLQVKKLQFWNKIVTFFVFDLDEENLTYIGQLFQKLDEYSTAAYTELCLEMIKTVFNKLDCYQGGRNQSGSQRGNQRESQGGNTPKVWKQVLTLFQLTFEHLMNLTVHNEELFSSLSHLLYYEYIVIERSAMQLDEGGRNVDNTDVMYLWLRNHMLDHLGERLPEECKEQNDNFLKKLFNDRNEGAFSTILHDYKVSLLRWLKMTQRGYMN